MPPQKPSPPLIPSGVPEGDGFAGNGLEGGSILGPIVVDYFGRDGSTAMLKVLSSSPRIVVPGSYPFEDGELSRILSCPQPGAAWAAYSGRLASDVPGALYYAEKMIDVRKLGRHLLPIRTIVMLRDPRDTYVSIEAFSRAVGRAEMGGVGGEASRLGRFIERQDQRLEWIAGLTEDESTTIVRYELLAGDLASTGAAVATWLGLVLDPSVVTADFRLRWVHGTSPSPSQSIGRWREELPASTARRLEDALGGRMRAVGYTD